MRLKKWTIKWQVGFLFAACVSLSLCHIYFHFYQDTATAKSWASTSMSLFYLAAVATIVSEKIQKR
jgi:hypothetical protein